MAAERRRGHSLERWEVALVKAMLKERDPRHRTDQDILAYFTRPMRSVNHRLIGQIRKGMVHKAVQPADGEELVEFLATWPDIDHQTGLSLRGDELLIKAREAMIAAVHTFNGAGLHFRAELFIVTAIIAWTYLHHAFYKLEGIDYRYTETIDGVRTVKLTPSGAEKFWELRTCLGHSKCPLSKPAKDNLEFLIELRNEIEHRSTSRIDETISSHLQACCINFNEQIKALFGAQYGLERRLPIALQFMTFGSDQRTVLKRAVHLPRNIEIMMDSFKDRLSPEEQEDPAFAYRVHFSPKLANRPGSADEVKTFVKITADEEAGDGTIYLKEVERRKYRPSEIVKLMNKEGYARFRISDHTDLWKTEDAKNIKSGFGVSIFEGQWVWYENWVVIVRAHCAAYAEYFGKAGAE